MFVAQIHQNLRDNDIDLNATPADATPLRCFSQVGEDFDALGPLFATDTLLAKANPVQQHLNDLISATSESGRTASR